VDLGFLLKGLLLGFSVAAPVGPIGVLCVRRTLTEGRASGLVSGLGAATADAFYGSVAGFGLAFISDLLLAQRIWLSALGGLYLCYLGLTTFCARPAETAAEAKSAGLARSYLTTLFLTITNPMTILSFAATFAGLGIASAAGGYRSSASLVLGVFLGSALWWLVLSTGVHVFRSRFTLRSLRWLNRASGAIIVGFGLWALVGLLRSISP
jgi:threonine/homoserine/homoserine lactone efflux protein